MIPRFCEQIEFNLTSSGYTVQTAFNGVDALKMMMLQAPELLITDVMMPEMDGFELAASVRGDSHLSSLPIIMLTARTLESDMLQGHQSGTDIYLTKPYDPAELLAFVERIVPLKD